MSEQEIIEGNKLIAEFWGSNSKLDSELNIIYWTFDESWYEIFNDYDTGSSWVCGSFRFHKSWNWLIPIIDKIEDLDVSDQHYQWEMEGETRSNFMCFEFDMNRHSDGYSASIWMELSLDPVCLVAGSHLKPYSTRIEAVWNTVIEFIKYYNETYEKVV